MRKNNNTIRVKNELPELLEAVWNHDDCPEWLAEAIWDAFSNRDMKMIGTANYWRSQFESMYTAAEVAERRECIASLENKVLDAEVLND